MQLSRKHRPIEEQATGIIAPLVKAAGHFGYSIRVAEMATDESWEEDRKNIFVDLKEALMHLQMISGPTPFVGPEPIEWLHVLINETGEMAEAGSHAEDDDEYTKEMVIANLQALMHDCANVARLVEYDCTGQLHSEGLRL